MYCRAIYPSIHTKRKEMKILDDFGSQLRPDVLLN